MARIDVLKEEIAEAREKKRMSYIGLLFCGLIYFLMMIAFPNIPRTKEATTIWTMFIFFTVLIFVGCGWYIDNRIKKLMKELETISRRA